MRWTVPGDADYDERRALFNAMIDRRPRMIASCADAADVAAALARARADGLAVAVRSGGHAVAGQSSVDDGLVVDVRPMRSVTVDPARRRARVGAGCTWADLDAATQVHGLATTGGRVSTTGVSGLTLGGGSGWLERRHGLTCDNLLAVELVTADGRQVRADEHQHPDLLWACKGGGGNFGVVTSLELALHPVGPLVLGGLLLWPVDRAGEVARRYRDLAPTTPPELGSGLVLLTGPPEPFVPAHLQGRPLVALVLVWSGDEGTGTDVLRAFRALEPEVDLVAPLPYTQMQSMLDDQPGLRQYWSGEYHRDLPDAALDVFLAVGAARPSPLTQHLVFPWGGAVQAVAEDATPLSRRDAAWITHPFATWVDPADDAANIAWVRGYRAAIAPWAAGGTYLNFIGDEGEQRIIASFGAANLRRLREVKAAYDPENLFAGNQNIRPLVPA
ncbi:FAD/FMN-containing dehydrogenase [Friedmanniella luteola]|uniref:FAD/FMN-containing dehydrogenase n=1 Tax=Friedmanniella luteola TaxID=546871 RepID=A0A1H1V157_9ACTN|nr:FAD-binding oxidoreductase [Friedmanniella luteola]SDS77889.1 FAD/FMN-containing dehydrogenase [Friedmanniella luteola]